MGSNLQGQLGIDDPYIAHRYSPVLVESLLHQRPVSLTCGAQHSLCLGASGDVYSWGNNDNGQCGIGSGQTFRQI